MYVYFKNGKFEKTIKEKSSIKESQNVFYLFRKNLFFGRRYEDFLVIVNNLGFLLKDMDLEKTFKEKLLEIIYLLNDVSSLVVDYNLNGEELINTMLNKLKKYKCVANNYELNLTLSKVEGYELTTEEYRNYKHYTNLNFWEMLEAEEPLDMNKVNYIVDDGTFVGCTDINSKSNFWAISLIDAETTDCNWELYKNLKEMLFNIGDLPKEHSIVYNKDGHIIYTEITPFNLHKETVIAVNQLLNALRYALNCYSFKTKSLLDYDLNKIDNKIEFFKAIMANSYEVANSQFKSI